MFFPRASFKIVYFKRSIIRSNWGRMNDRPLRRAGALVRRLARQSIRRDRRRRVLKSGKIGSYGKPSPRGTPPYSRAPGAPFKLIFNLPNGAGSEIVGMVGFGSGFGTPIPGLHEHGGRATRKVFIRGVRRRGGSNQRVNRVVRYPRRPFMIPALLKGRRLMPSLWRNSL